MSEWPYTEKERAARKAAKKIRTYKAALEKASNNFTNYSISFPSTGKSLGELRTNAHNLHRLIYESLEPHGQSKQLDFRACMGKSKSLSKEEMMKQAKIDCHTVATSLSRLVDTSSCRSQEDLDKTDLLHTLVRLRENLHSQPMSFVLMETLKSASEIRTSIYRPGGLTSYATAGRVRQEALRADINNIRRTLLMYLGASEEGGVDERGNITPLPVCDQRITEIDFSKCSDMTEKWNRWVTRLNRVIGTCDASECSAVMRIEAPSLATSMVEVLVGLGCRTEPLSRVRKSVT